VKKALDRKHHCSRKEMPKAMANANTKPGRMGKVMRVTRIRATGNVNQHVSIAIRKGIKFGTA
jgi:hypothetical protein